MANTITYPIGKFNLISNGLAVKPRYVMNTERRLIIPISAVVDIDRKTYVLCSITTIINGQNIKEEEQTLIGKVYWSRKYQSYEIKILFMGRLIHIHLPLNLGKL